MRKLASPLSQISESPPWRYQYHL